MIGPRVLVFSMARGIPSRFRIRAVVTTLDGLPELCRRAVACEFAAVRAGKLRKMFSEGAKSATFLASRSRAVDCIVQVVDVTADGGSRAT